MANLMLIFCVLLQFLTTANASPRNVTFTPGTMSERDTVTAIVTLSVKWQPFFLRFSRNGKTMGGIYIRGHRQQIYIRSVRPTTIMKPKTIKPKGTYKLDVKQQKGSEMEVFWENEYLKTIRFNARPDTVSLAGAFARAEISKGKWRNEVLRTDRECGRVQTLVEIQSGLCLKKCDRKCPRIIEESPANGGQHPWQVAIRYKPRMGRTFAHACGGALIDSCWVITAAHCFAEQMRPENVFTVRVGDYYNGDDQKESYKPYERPEEFDIEKVISHVGYWTLPSTRNDIALVRLQKKPNGGCAEFSDFVQPICLPTIETDFVNVGCAITGWGASEHGQGAGLFPGCLQQATVMLVDGKTCKTYYGDTPTRHERIVNSTMQCAAGEIGSPVDACQGYSGGPLVCYPDTQQYFLMGIASWGEDCGRKPGVYTRVSGYLDWIDQKMYEFSIANPSVTMTESSAFGEHYRPWFVSSSHYGGSGALAYFRIFTSKIADFFKF